MNLKKLYIAILIVFCVQSCNMDESPYTAGSDMSETPAGASQMVNSIYNVFWSTGLMKKAYMECIDMDHDHAAAPTWVVSGAGEGNITTHWSYNTSSDPFNAFYRMISRANYAIENIPSVPSIEDSERDYFMGEAYFLRAFAYFHLVRMYGPVPLRLKFDISSDMTRSDVMTVYQQIEADLLLAAEKMPWSTSMNQWGRTNKTAAKLLLAKVYATIGSSSLSGSVNLFVNIKGEQTKIITDKVGGFDGVDSKDYYEKVKELCDEVIALRGQYFDLRSSFSSIWGNQNTRNNEFVWGVAGNNQLEFTTEHLGYYYSAIPYNGRGWAGISEHAYQLYGDTDERGEHGIFHYIKQSFTSTSAYVRIPNNQAKYPTGPDGKPTRGVDNYYNTIFITKWYLGDVVNPTPVTQDPGYSLQPQDIPLIRFVDAYLLRAEALAELNQASESLADLNEVRKRARAEEYLSVQNQEELRSLILNERALEYMQEFNRKFDLLRWGAYLHVMNNTGTIRVQGSGLTISKIREPRSVLYAAPLNEINNNKLFGPNNIGW